MRLFLIVMVLALTTACTRDVKFGRIYKVESGFFKNCIGIAASSFERIAPCFDCLQVRLEYIKCANGTISSEYFESSNLTEVTK